MTPAEQAQLRLEERLNRLSEGRDADWWHRAALRAAQDVMRYASADPAATLNCLETTLRYHRERAEAARKETNHG